MSNKIEAAGFERLHKTLFNEGPSNVYIDPVATCIQISPYKPWESDEEADEWIIQCVTPNPEWYIPSHRGSIDQVIDYYNNVVKKSIIYDKILISKSWIRKKYRENKPAEFKPLKPHELYDAFMQLRGPKQMIMETLWPNGRPDEE